MVLIDSAVTQLAHSSVQQHGLEQRKQATNSNRCELPGNFIIPITIQRMAGTITTRKDQYCSKPTDCLYGIYTVQYKPNTLG